MNIMKTCTHCREELILKQRKTHRVCDNCGYPYITEAEEIAAIEARNYKCLAYAALILAMVLILLLASYFNHGQKIR